MTAAVPVEEAGVAAVRLTHLQRLEAESIHILREVGAECERPVMLYSIGKDSSVMLHLALKAFHPGRPPFPLLHVDTTWKFRQMIEFRDQTARRLGMDLIVHVNPDGIAMGINPFVHGSALHTDIMKTQGLRQALDQYGFDAAFGGARRDEEKSRAKERVFSIRSAQHRWDPKRQRPELWRLYNTRKAKGESLRVFPLSNWTELDIWQYIHREDIAIVPLYFAAERPVVERDGALILVDDERMPLAPGEQKRCRFTDGHHRGDAGGEDLRAPGQGDRSRRCGVDGKEEAGRLLLMNAELSAPVTDVNAWLQAQSRKDLLRFITC